MGNFLSKLVTGNPFANEDLRTTLLNPSLMPGVRGAPQINLANKGGQAQPLPTYSGNTLQSPIPTDQGVGGLVIPQKFGNGLLGASRRGIGARK